MIHRLLLAGVSAIAITTAAPAFAEDATRAFDIPAQPLSSALLAYSRATDTPVIASMDLLAGKTAPEIKGDMPEGQALAMLLQGTGLKAERGATGSIVVERVSADPQSGSAAGDGADAGTVAALIVTAQKKEEQIQDVPIAISAFTEKSLEEQKIEGGFDLLKAIPNVTFSKNNFSGYNFSIRGIGTKAVSVTTDPGVAVSFNSTTLIRNRLFEQEYFDVERVEVLRGPQGTLYGRNATSGVVNVISAKPNLHEFSGMVKAEVGNYQSRRMVGMVNIPLVDDKLAIRIAGSATMRDGYNIDLYDNSRVDGRNLWSGRVTIGFNPSDRFRSNLIWEHFNEDDNRSRTGKQLCTHDAGPDEIGGFPIAKDALVTRGYLSQGCLPGSLYDAKAFGTPNGLSIPFVLAEELFSLGAPPGTNDEKTAVLTDTDPYGNTTQSHDLRALYSQLKPVYRAKADIYELNMDFDVTSGLTLTSQTAYDGDKLYSSQDYNRYTTVPTFQDTSSLVWGDGRPSDFQKLIPGGIFCDPQLGCSNTIVGMDISRAKSTQFSQEFRLQSSFSGRLNFSAGLDYTRYKTVEDYYVFFNGATLAAVTSINATLSGGFFANGFRSPDKFTTNPDCSILSAFPLCVPIEQNSINNIKDVGHNYFLSRNPYKLDSRAAFGELYFQVTDNFKLTAGLRYTDDPKTFTPIPSETLLTGPEVPAAVFPPAFLSLVLGFPLFGLGQGYPALPDIHNQWKEFTGRFGADWKPTLTFTDQTMLYAFYSRGYKGGGMNPPPIGLNVENMKALGLILAPSAPPSFRPEFVNAFEVGTKNTLLGGSLVLNGDAFFYDYKDYQVSKIVDRSAQNENFDAKVWGLEFEGVWQPTRNLRFNASLGYLDTELGKGSKSIDVMNRTAGRTDWIVVKPSITLTSNCIIPVSVASQILASGAVAGAVAKFNWGCPGGGTLADNLTGKPPFGHVLPDGTTYDPADHPEAGYGAGFSTDVSGHELPNAPHYTVSLGGQYSVDFLENWRATLRADFYWQSQQWARIYELPVDKLHAWKNGNVRLTFERPDDGLEIELYAKNVFNDTPITDTFTNSDDTALTTNIFVLDPRILGLSIKKTF